MRLGPVCLILVMAFVASVAVAQDEFWLPRSDEANSGVSAESLKLPISLQWKHSTGDEEATPVAMPAVGSKMIYAPVGVTMYAIDRNTGELVWSLDTGAEIYSSPALSGDTLYFGSRDHSLYAVNAEDGQVKWRYLTGGPVDCTPVIVGDTLYFGSDDNRLVALDLGTSKPRWQFETNGDIKATPLVYRDVVVVGSQDRHIYCLNSEGRPMWTNTLGARAFFAAPTGERTKVIYACGKEIIAREIYTGRRIWRFKTAGIVSGAPCVKRRTAYVGTAAGAIYAINTNDGRGLWRYPAQGATEPITSSPTVVDDMLVFRAGTRQIVAIALRDGAERWSYLLPEPPEKAADKIGAGAGAGGMDPGMGGPIDFPGEGNAPGVDQPVGDNQGRNTTGTNRVEKTYKIEENVDPAVAVADDSVYVIGDDNIVYAFTTAGADNVPPTITDAILDVPGKQRTRVSFSPSITAEDDFPDRYAEDIIIPGTPPLFLSMVINDEGSGINADAIKVIVNDIEIDDYAYDANAGLLWYIYDPRGAAMNLDNGVKCIVFEVTDWRGNTSAACVSFTIDNKAQPPEPPQPKASTMDMGEMGPGGEMVDPGMMEMAPPPM